MHQRSRMTSPLWPQRQGLRIAQQRRRLTAPQGLHIGRGGGKRRQPLALAISQGTFHQPASGQGQGGAEVTWRQLDALPQLAAEAEGGSGAKERQGAGGGDKGGLGPGT
jgi:hypothetical protein